MVLCRAKSPSSVSSSDSNPTVTDLDETGLVDPISDLRTHFIPDAEATPAPTTEEHPAGDEDRRAIEEMEAEYPTRRGVSDKVEDLYRRYHGR